jgi:hypothetical protein
MGFYDEVTVERSYPEVEIGQAETAYHARRVATEQLMAKIRFTTTGYLRVLAKNPPPTGDR